MIYIIYNILKVYIIFEGVGRDRKILFSLLSPFLLTYSISISRDHHPERFNTGIISSIPCLPECPSQSKCPSHSLPLIALDIYFFFLFICKTEFILRPRLGSTLQSLPMPPRYRKVAWVTASSLINHWLSLTCILNCAWPLAPILCAVTSILY